MIPVLLGVILIIFVLNEISTGDPAMAVAGEMASEEDLENIREDMGLNKPIHFTDFDASVRDIVNITAVAVIDAYVDKIKREK